jgi:uncharacterized protein HemY
MDDLLQTTRELKDASLLDAAQVLLRHVIETDLDNAQAYLDLGLIFYEQADYGQAVKALRVACALRPDQGVTYYHLARAYQAVGDEGLMRAVRFQLALVAPELYAKLNRQKPPPVSGG